MAILPTPEPTPTPAPTPPPFPEPKPVREPDPDRLPDEAPVPNPDENDAPLKIAPDGSEWRATEIATTTRLAALRSKRLSCA